MFASLDATKERTTGFQRSVAMRAEEREGAVLAPDEEEKSTTLYLDDVARNVFLDRLCTSNSFSTSKAEAIMQPALVVCVQMGPLSSLSAFGNRISISDDKSGCRWVPLTPTSTDHVLLHGPDFSSLSAFSHCLQARGNCRFGNRRQDIG